MIPSAADGLDMTFGGRIKVAGVPRRPACKCSEFAESYRKTQSFTAGASRTPPLTISHLDFFYKLRGDQ